jgi:hypothetical protein
MVRYLQIEKIHLSVILLVLKTKKENQSILNSLLLMNLKIVTKLEEIFK